MEMGVQHIAHIAELEPVLLELVLDHVLMELKTPHAEGLHDLVRAVAGVDQHWPGPAENEEAKGRDAPGAAAIATQDKEARFELNVAVVENLDFERHFFPPLADLCPIAQF